MKGFATFGVVVLVLVVFLGLPWLIMGNEFFLNQYFAPKNEDVRRETFENSHSYQKGMIQEIENMRFEYEKADPSHKAGLASIILRRAADFGEDKLPAELKAFVQQLRREQNQPIPPKAEKK